MVRRSRPPNRCFSGLFNACFHESAHWGSLVVPAGAVNQCLDISPVPSSALISSARRQRDDLAPPAWPCAGRAGGPGVDGQAALRLQVVAREFGHSHHGWSKAKVKVAALRPGSAAWPRLERKSAERSPRQICFQHPLGEAPMLRLSWHPSDVSKTPWHPSANNAKARAPVSRCSASALNPLQPVPSRTAVRAVVQQKRPRQPVLG